MRSVLWLNGCRDGWPKRNRLLLTSQLKRWVCCQIGSREHYAVPRVLHRSGRLARVYTDYWAGTTIRKLAGRLDVRTLRSLAGRFHPDLERAAVTSWNGRALLWEKGLQSQTKCSSSNELFAVYAEVGCRFASAVRNSLRQDRRSSRSEILFAYDTGALETFEWCREQGIKCVLNQMDPNRVEAEMVREEEMRWPGWAVSPTGFPDTYFRRREQEWALADRVVVNSEFCKQALLKQGVAPEKLFVIPLCYELEGVEAKFKDQKAVSNFSAASPLRVLWLGQVILRKGIQYLLAAARQLKQENIKFDIVGPIGISQEAIASAPHNVTFHGRATRDRAAGWYRQSDIFVLPTLSDGFAITQIEAMEHGLPVVTTSCCGDVVSDGLDGFIVHVRDIGALARALMWYLGNPAELKAQQIAARAKAKKFTLERLAAHFLRLEQSLFQ